MIQNAISCNKHLTKEYFEGKPIRVLMAFTHPSDRGDYAVEISKIMLEIQKSRENAKN